MFIQMGDSWLNADHIVWAELTVGQTIKLHMTSGRTLVTTGAFESVEVLEQLKLLSAPGRLVWPERPTPADSPTPEEIDAIEPAEPEPEPVGSWRDREPLC